MSEDSILAGFPSTVSPAYKRVLLSERADRRAVELGYDEYPDMGAMLRYFEWCFPGQTGGES